VPQFLMSGGAQSEGSGAGLIPTAMLSSMFGQMMPEAAGTAEGSGAGNGKGEISSRGGVAGRRPIFFVNVGWVERSETHRCAESKVEPPRRPSRKARIFSADAQINADKIRLFRFQ